MSVREAAPAPAPATADSPSARGATPAGGARPGCRATAPPRPREHRTAGRPGRGGRPSAPAGGPPASTRVRLLAVPVSTPPALLPGQPDGVRAHPHPGQQVLLLPGAPRRRHPWEDADPAVAARASSDDELPDPTGTCGALAAAVVEVLSGHRPASQLVRWTTLEVHAELQRRAALAARLRPARPSRRPGSATLAAGPSRAGRPAVVRRVRVCRPAEGVVEASAVVVDGDRVRAVALRLEGWDRRWRATAVEVG